MKSQEVLIKMSDKYGHNKIEVHCKDCNVLMYRRTDTFKTWSGRCVSCYQKNRKDNAKGNLKKKIEVCCSDCGTKWMKRKDGMRKWNGRCKECCQKYKHSTPEQKEKCRGHMKAVRDKYNGKMPLPGYKSGKEHINWKGGLPKCIDCGTELSLYTCKRCVKCNGKSKIGENHFNWKGGISDENIRVRQSPEYRQWRKEVFKRDKWACVMCGKKNNELRADHIKPFHLYPELRLDVSNGRTLCVPCDKIHGYNYYRDRLRITNPSVN
jgi:hypothetical protein